MTVDLPPELAPALRAAAEQLLAECTEAEPRPVTGKPWKGRGPRSRRAPCFVCRGTTGPMGLHHRVPGDHSTVVPIHPACHRKLHRSGRS